MNTKPTFLALGDSYTIGEGVEEAERWPAQLCQKMDFASPDYIAKTGWTSWELHEAIHQARISHFYDWVSLLVGVNNQYRGLSLEEYSVEFTRLVFQALALSHNRPDRVLVLSIPDYGVTPFAREMTPPKIHDEINAYNAVNEGIAQREKVHYIPITDISRQAAYDQSLLAADHLHPSGKMYGLWVDRIIQKIQPTLELG